MKAKRKGAYALASSGSGWDRKGSVTLSVLFFLLCPAASVRALDWPQYRGPATDGSTPERILQQWVTTRPGFVVWTNNSLTNGFSSFAVSQGRAFTMITRIENGVINECCVGIDASTGSNLWVTPVGVVSWDPSATGNGGSGAAPYYMGDGPRTTPSVKEGRVFVLSGYLRLLCLNTTNGSVVWSSDLRSAFGGTILPWENGASPCFDNDLIFVSLNSSTAGRNLAAFRTSDGGMQWSSQSEGATHSTPVVATISGVRQVLFNSKTGVVSLNRTNGAFLWKFTYPFGSIGTAMGASAVVHSNIVYCTYSYGKGAAAATVTLSNGLWSVAQLYYKTGLNYESIWMTPVCYRGYVYTLCGNNGGFLTQPLNCIELSTGNLMWSTNGFGKGGLILVNTNLLVLTEKGLLVLVDPNPAGYRERARYQALAFDSTAPGKCWNSPAFSNGRIYARGTRGGVCIDVSPPALPQLKLWPPQSLNSTQFQVKVGTADGTPIGADRVAGIELRSTNTLDGNPALWTKLTNELVLATNGVAVLTNTVGAGPARQFYRASEPQ